MISWKRLVYFLFMAAVLLTCFVVFVPFLPDMPRSGLDPSWVLGMNQAVSQGLTMGADVVFTFGPYASVYTRSYHPDTDALMLFGSTCLAVFYWLYLLVLAQGRKYHWLLMLALVIVGLIRSYDILLYSIPLMLGLVIFKVYCLDGGCILRRRWHVGLMGLLFVPLGLLPVIKGSMLVICGAVAGLCLLLFIYQRLYRNALVVATYPVVSMVLFWVGAGQDALGLPLYIWNMLPIFAGYTEAMAIPGSRREIAVFIAASAALFLAINVHRQLTVQSKLFLSGLFFVFLYLAFKAGFVRHDTHALAAAGALFLAAVLLGWVVDGWRVLLAATLCLCAGWYIDSHYLAKSPQSFVSKAGEQYSKAWRGMASRLMQPAKLRLHYDRKMASLQQEGGLPLLAGTSDIYAYEQSLLIASDNVWSPRPIFQSYAAYTPSLAEKNRRHLQGKTAPDNIFFGVQSIDGRFPSLDDGASWLDLLSAYRPVDFAKGYLVLKRRKDIGAVRQRVVYSKEHAFGEEIVLPEGHDPLFLRLAIKKSLVGSLVSFLYKPSQLSITVKLENAQVRKYRIISGMAHSKFMLSPLIQSGEEFGLLYGSETWLKGKKVESFSIAAEDAGYVWQPGFSVELTSVAVERPRGLAVLYGFKPIDYSLNPADIKLDCAGGIERIAGGAVAPEVRVSELLEVSGWLASSVAEYAPAESAYIVLSGHDRSRGFVRAEVVKRHDVAKYFNITKMENAGFNVKVDLAGLSGDYEVGLAIQKDGRLRLCRNPPVHVHVEN